MVLSKKKKKRFKTMFGAVVIMVFGYLVCPCVLPLVIQPVLTLLKAVVERKMATQLYLLQCYQRVNPISEDEKNDAF
jgi:cytochrome c biogenesis protein CcdA